MKRMKKSKTTSLEPDAHHILIVDDCEVIRVVTQQYLERAGYAVATAENGHRALEALKDKRFDLILMDLVMPDMDGFEAARRIRDEEHRMRPATSSAESNAECGPAVVPQERDYGAASMRNEKTGQLEISSEMPDSNHKCACSDNKGQAQKHSCSEDDCKCRRAGLDQNSKSEINEVAIIGMSGHDPQSVKEECFDAGMNACLGKPLKQETLLSMVQKWIIGRSDIPQNVIARDRSARLHRVAAEKQPPIDIEKAVTEFMGKTDLLREVLKTFKTRVRAQIMNIKQHMSAKDFDPILSEAHSIKGGAGNLGALNLSQAAAELEEAAGEESTARATAAMADLEKEFQRLYQYIEQSEMGKAI